MSTPAAERTAMQRRVEARMAECPHRRGATCAQLDDALGWPAGIDFRACDACFAGDAPIVPTLRGRIIDDVMRAPRAGWPEIVAQRIAERHCSIDDAATFVVDAAAMYDRAFVGRLMHLILMRSDDVAWRSAFIERLDQADIAARSGGEIPRTKEAWRAHPSCGALITKHCESCNDFAWISAATGDTTVKCKRMGCPSTCRSKYLKPTVSCPRGLSAQRAREELAHV